MNRAKAFYWIAQSPPKVDALIRRYHFDLNPESRIENLSVGEKQRVEILKALYNESSIILLDEPTAVLTPRRCRSSLPCSGS